jgi:hypothetical protein
MDPVVTCAEVVAAAMNQATGTHMPARRHLSSDAMSPPRAL